MDLGDDDLFGDEEEVESPQDKVRELDDEELDSGDDKNRHDRDGEAMEEDPNGFEEKLTRFIEGNVARHHIPKPSDGEVSTGGCQFFQRHLY